ALSAAGIRSLACLPLRVDNTPVGALLCGTRSPTVIAQDEWLLLVELASNLSFALQYLDKQNAVHFLSYFEPLTGLAKRALFCEPRRIACRDVVAEIKSGVACYPQDNIEPHDLVQNAEAALKEAKTSGERYLHHRVEMNAELARRLSMEQRLRAALETDQFRLYYQPKIALRNGRVAGVEALLRWQDPETGLVAPAVFLPLLESAGLMTAAGTWVIRQAA